LYILSQERVGEEDGVAVREGNGRVNLIHCESK